MFKHIIFESIENYLHIYTLHYVTQQLSLTPPSNTKSHFLTV